METLEVCVSRADGARYIYLPGEGNRTGQLVMKVPITSEQFDQLKKFSPVLAQESADEFEDIFKKAELDRQGGPQPDFEIGFHNKEDPFEIKATIKFDDEEEFTFVLAIDKNAKEQKDPITVNLK